MMTCVKSAHYELNIMFSLAFLCEQERTRFFSYAGDRLLGKHCCFFTVRFKSALPDHLRYSSVPFHVSYSLSIGGLQLLITIAIFIPFLAALFVPFIYKQMPSRKIGWFVLLVPFSLFIILASFISSVAGGETYIHTFRWIDSAGINFTTYLDGLSIIFGLLITGVGTLVILYSIYYLSEREALGRFYVYLLMFMGAMLGVVFSDNLMVLYVFWELTSISSFLLIAFWYHRKQSRYGAQK